MTSREPVEQRHDDATREEDGWRRNNMGRLLNRAVARLEARVFELLSAAGHDDVPLAHLHLTRNLDLDGNRITELARRASMTKQAMSELVGRSRDLGLVTEVVDPRDRRAKLISFSAAGRAWLSGFRRALAMAEQEMVDDLTGARVEALRAILTDYASGSTDPRQLTPRTRPRRPARVVAASTGEPPPEDLAAS